MRTVLLSLKTDMANIITGIRILISAALLFFPAFSPAFYVLYLTGGFSDMIDGAVARKTGTVSRFGAKLDTFADIVFTAACLIKLLPVLDIPVWIYLWIAGIAAIKLTSIVSGSIRHKELPAVHSFLNKVAGALLFIFPLTLSFIELKYSASIVCAAAAAAATQEAYLVHRQGLKYPGHFV